MKRIFVLSFIMLSTIMAAQLRRSDSRLNDAYTDLTNRIEPNSTNMGTTNLNGSPYFDPEFKEATVTYFGKILDDKVYLRYNAISDEMEMSLSPHATHSDQALIKNSKVSCDIKGAVYRYLPLINGNTLLAKAGYVKEIYIGQKYSLYLRERKVFREGKKARTSLERSFPARFVDESEWYFQKNQGVLNSIKLNKKNIKNYFESDIEHLETFLKNKKGDFKNIDYLKKLVRFMDELT